MKKTLLIGLAAVALGSMTACSNILEEEGIVSPSAKTGTLTIALETDGSLDVATKTECYGKRALVMGKLYKRNGDWKFAAIGDAFEDRSIVHTIARVMKDYSK